MKRTVPSGISGLYETLSRLFARSILLGAGGLAAVGVVVRLSGVETWWGDAVVELASTFGLAAASIGWVWALWIRPRPRRTAWSMAADGTVGVSLSELLVAVVLLAVSALGFVAASSASLSGPGLEFEVFELLGVMVVSWSGWYLARRAELVSDAPGRWWELFTPYVTAAVLLGVQLNARWDAGLGSRAYVDVVVTGVIVLVVIRQFLSLRSAYGLVANELDHLVSSVSHELRTPLTAVLGFAEVLSESWDVLSESEKQEMLGMVVDEARRASNLAVDLVAVSRDRAGEVPLQVVPTGLRGVVSDAVVAAGPAGARVMVDESVAGDVLVDRRRMVQVLTILLENAALYGGRSTLVRVSPVRRSDGLVRLEIHDDGPGVPAEFQSVVWDRFERGAHHLDAGVPGAGVGLSIARGLVAAHGGELWYEDSQLLGGACFVVTVPPAVEVVPPAA